MSRSIRTIDTRPDNSPRPVRYHLRFQIIPGRQVESRAKDLAKFCREHGIEEVVLFFAGEEWNDGLLSAAAEDAWLEAVRRSKQILERAGLSVSLNPWMTILHCDRGRRFPRGRKFDAAVSPTGVKSKACGSFADPKWRQYWQRLVSRFAALGFRVIWVEDDFRFHNHAPLDWGGGFEEAVLRRFRKAVGGKPTREQVVRNVLAPGRPHPWRAVWMDTWRQVQLEVAQLTAETVARHSPGPSRLGLMSSHPTSHSAEGRDWSKVMAALSVDGRAPAHRPHFAGYEESTGLGNGYSIMMLDVQKGFRPADSEVAPEVENFPYTHWTKSDSLTWSQMALCQFYGSDALLLNLIPFTGNAASTQPQVGAMLDRARPALEWIAARFPKAMATGGVGLPWRQDANLHVRTRAGKSMFELDATSFGPGWLLLPYGVPVSAGTQRVNAVFGSLAWAFSDADVTAMLRGGLMLDATSAGILAQRGFGALLGANVRRFVEREHGRYSMERLTAASRAAAPGTCLSCNLLDRMAVLAPARGASVWTEVIEPDGKPFGAGMVAFTNSLGGRVITYAAPEPAALPRSYERQALTLRAVEFLSGGQFDSAVVTEAANCMPIHLRHGNRQAVVVHNTWPDAARPAITMQRAAGAPKACTLLGPLARPAKADVAVTTSRRALTIRTRSEIPYLGFLVLEW